jgi:transcriptional regulator with XRE-family HTH domain
MKLFGLTVSQISKAGGCSRPYLSRALSGSLVPSPKFYRVLEANLGRLVAEKGSQLFAIPATECDETVQEVLKA